MSDARIRALEREAVHSPLAEAALRVERCRAGQHVRVKGGWVHPALLFEKAVCAHCGTDLGNWLPLMDSTT